MAPANPPSSTPDGGPKAFTLAFESPEPLAVAIEVELGGVHLVADDGGNTRVTVRPTDAGRRQDIEAAEQTRIDNTPGRLSVKAPRTRGLRSLGIGRPGSVEITIELPAGSDVVATAGFADFLAQGELGDVHIKAGAGDVRLEGTGRLDLTSGAGAVDVETATGPAEVTSAGDIRLGRLHEQSEVKNLNGKTRIGEAGGELRISSANGDIAVGRSEAGVHAKTANGDIRIGTVVAGTVDLETGSGTIDVGVQAGTPAWIDAGSRFGRVRNNLEAVDGPEPSARTAEVRARTSFGDVVIHRG